MSDQEQDPRVGGWKPPNCTCGYPQAVAPNPTGHAANCPIFREWAIEQGDPRRQEPGKGKRTPPETKPL